MQILPAEGHHFPAILDLNEMSVEVLAPLAHGRLELLRSRASYHRVVLDSEEVVAVALAFGSDAGHDSVNFKWFAAAYPSFLYIDRVVVAASRRGEGIGSLLCRDLFAFARRGGHRVVTCEIDVDPHNCVQVV